MLFAILFLICYMFLMFIKATNNKAYESLFNFTSMNIPHMCVFFACMALSTLMTFRVIYNFPFEIICLLVVIASHYAFKSKTLIKSKIKSFLKNMLED